MNEMIIEALVQKNNTLIQELYSLNLLVRSLPPTPEIMSNLHARMDAMQASLVAMEKAMVRDNEKIASLEQIILNQSQQIKYLKDITESQGKALQEQAANYLRSQQSVLKTIEKQGEEFETELAQQLVGIRSRLFVGKAIVFLALIGMVFYIFIKTR